MEKNKKYFEDKFKDFESAPPLGVWNDIESGLDKKARKRRAIIFMRIAAGLALLLTAAWFTWTSVANDENKLTHKDVESKIERVEEQKAPEKEQIAAIDSKNLQKLIQPQNIQSPEKEIESVKKEDETKSNIPNVESKKVQETPKEIVKDSIMQTEGKNKIDKIDFIEQRSLLAENEIDSMPTAQAPDHKELLAQAETTLESETNINTQKDSDAKSITIILRPKSNNEALALNEEPNDDKGTFEKFKESINNDYYKYKIRLGEVPDLALNKLKLKSN